MAKDFGAEIKKILNDYVDEADEATERAIEKCAKNGVKSLKQKRSFAPSSNATGKYASGWTMTKESGRLSKKITIHNRIYRLPHLLEFGHVIRNGTGRSYGSVRAYPHIAPVEEQITKEIEKIVTEELK